jgi:hypothetical protein
MSYTYLIKHIFWLDQFYDLITTAMKLLKYVCIVLLHPLIKITYRIYTQHLFNECKSL